MFCPRLEYKTPVASIILSVSHFLLRGKPAASGPDLSEGWTRDVIWGCHLYWGMAC